ncbi:MAG: hypothetical protein JSW34_02150 [Candidatus Zixiibacteriota bacterium]|nr:MAG: hypothetical protein JSW34_02150 [candidate division Zixibacteria bacterium]
MTKERIACAQVINFPMAVCLRGDRSLWGKPVALAQTTRESSPICAVNKNAGGCGVFVGMTVGQAMSYCPELIVKKTSSAKETKASEKIRDILFTASPLIEETDPGCYFLDASGLKWLYKNEEDLAQRLVSLIISLKLPVQAGVAGCKFVASVAARTSPVNSFTVVPPNTERRFLNHLTIDHLPLSEETRERLAALGLKTIGQVAAFPSNEIISRFGEEGTNISRLARGDDVDFFVPEFARSRLSARIPLFEPLESARAIMAHVEKALTELLEKPRRADRGCATVYIKLHLEDKTDKSVRLALKQPVGTAQQFMRALVNQLIGLRLSSRVNDITVTIPEILPLVSSQMELLGVGGSLKGRLLDDRHITGELGRVSMFSPTTGDAVIPDSNFSFLPVGQKNKPAGKNKSGNANKTATGYKTGNACFYALNPVAGLRLLQPPQKTTVVARGKKLQQIRLRHQSKSIIEQKGPWQLSGGWWSRGFDRLYYEVQTGDNQMYLLYFDRQTPGWFVQGVFD